MRFYESPSALKRRYIHWVLTRWHGLPTEWAGQQVRWHRTSAGQSLMGLALVCFFEDRAHLALMYREGDPALAWNFLRSDREVHSRIFPGEAVADFFVAGPAVNVLEAHLLAHELEARMGAVFPRLKPQPVTDLRVTL